MSEPSAVTDPARPGLPPCPSSDRRWPRTEPRQSADHCTYQPRHAGIAGVSDPIEPPRTVGTLASTGSGCARSTGPVRSRRPRSSGWRATERSGGSMVDARSEVLDVGRARRLATPAQRAALRVRDRGCVFPGCDRPSEWCQAHHLVPFEDGGATDLDNLCLLCSHHHHLVHEGGWSLERIGITWVATEPGRCPPYRGPRPSRRAPGRNCVSQCAGRMASCSKRSSKPSAAAIARDGALVGQRPVAGQPAAVHGVGGGGTSHRGAVAAPTMGGAGEDADVGGLTSERREVGGGNDRATRPGRRRQPGRPPRSRSPTSRPRRRRRAGPSAPTGRPVPPRVVAPGPAHR